MKLDKIANSKNDEFYTPPYAVLPILEFIPKDSVVWCPFDTDESWFVKLLKENNIKVINSHIKNGKDFFCFEPKEDYDLIVSNPPYSLKNEVFERLYQLDKPFAMLVGIVGVFESKFRTDLFRNNQVEVLYLTKRVSYFQDMKEQKPSKNPPFQSAYVCSKLLPNQIMFSDIDKNNLGNNKQKSLFK